MEERAVNSMLQNGSMGAIQGVFARPKIGKDSPIRQSLQYRRSQAAMEGHNGIVGMYERCK